MLQSRRGFLIGLGSVLTTAFVAEAEALVRETCTPLLAQPPQVRHTLYWHLPEGSNAPLLCLDGSPHIMLPPPTWREYLNSLCASPSRFTTLENVDMWRRVYNVEPDPTRFANGCGAVATEL